MRLVKRKVGKGLSSKMIILNKDSETLIKDYVTAIIQFLETYRWVQDAYVSDFFYQDHWSRLPSSWQDTLGSMSTQDLSCLLDRSSLKSSRVLPLSLLSFHQCTKTFSLDRQPSGSIEEVVKSMFPGVPRTHEISSVTIHSEGTTSELHSYFRKHVKPKKQHEILSLSKVITELCAYLPCETVVDVGAGLGHLSRLLTFGYQLNTISVEAAGSHAPKATKYDQEVKIQLHKKQKREGNSSIKQSTESVSSALPCHVTNLIQPNMKTEDFLYIIQQQKDIEYSQSEMNECNFRSNEDHTRNDSIEKHKRHSSGRIASNDSKLIKMSGKLEESDRTVDCACAEKLCTGKLKTTSSSISCVKSDGNVGSHYLPGMAEQTANENKPGETVHHNCRNAAEVAGENMYMKTDAETATPEDTVEEQRMETLTDSSQDHSQVPSASECPKNYTSDLVKDSSLDASDWRFILTGLHACGDLTPTFLRFFVNCGAACGLASVGCCYMKMSDTSTETDSLGYPMSPYVAAIPDHLLSFNSRELACHFADTYSERLKVAPPHLKIHSYRAALEWVANQLNPTFPRSAVQIPAKKTNKMDFKGYARLGLEKLGISADLMTPELLQQAECMTARWKDVVAFYTVRLSLAPVVETLILLDRALYLLEQGYQSALVPIFDPSLSPRNFVLLSWKL